MPSLPLPSIPVPLPRLRGWIHLGAVAPALAAAVVLVVLAPGATARVACAVYAFGLVALFLGSAMYHRWWPDRPGKLVLRRIDHATIYVFIAGTYTPLVVLLTGGTERATVLVVVWVGAALGVLMAIVWIDAPRWLQAGTYVALGAIAVVLVPTIFDRGGTAAGVLVVAGALVYALGAVTYAAKRPDPWPTTFGFHELFHAGVTAAAIAHYVAICLVVL